MPESQDMLIQREPNGWFAIGPLQGAPQLECADFDEALRTAGRFAARDRRRLWFASGVGPPRPLPDVFSFRRLWNEFIDQPALRLTADQIHRFLSCDEATCRSVIDVLVELGFLRRLADGRYQRTSATCHHVRPLRMKRAGDGTAAHAA